jgi:outer membrane protein
MNRILYGFILWAALCASAAALPQEGQAGREGRPVTMREAVRLALARGPEVLLARAEAAKAAESVRETRSLNMPQIVAGTGLAYNNGFPLSIEGAAPSVFQAALSQSFLSGKNKNLIRESEAGSLAAQAGAEGARNVLAARTILLYGELHQARQAIGLAEQQRAAARRDSGLVDALVQGGRALPLDAKIAALAAADFDQQWFAAQERVRLAETGLRELTGIPEKESILTEPPEIASGLLMLAPDDLYQKALEAHPAIREAEAAVRARDFRIEAEKAEKYPQLTLVSQYALFSKTNNYQDFFNRFTRNNYILGLSVQVPVFNGFRTDARVSAARRDAEIARLRLQKLQSELKANLEKSASALRIAAGAATLARQAVSVYEEKLKVSETRLEAGRADSREVSEARARLLEKQAARIEADRALFERQVELLQLCGSLASMF